MSAARPGQRDPVLVLAGIGVLFALLAAADKLFGLIHRPLYLATASYALLLGVLGWAFFRGLRRTGARLVRVSGYGALLILVLLTAAYAAAWKRSADPTPVISQWQAEGELRRGDTLLKEGDKDGAFLVYQEAYRRYPRSFQVLMRMGAINYQVNDYERAKRYFSRALDMAPPRSRWRALNDLGQSYWKLSEPQQTVDLYLEAQQAGIPLAEQTEWHYRLAWAYFDLKDYDAAIEHYQAVVDANRTYVAASYYNIACAQAEKLKEPRSAAERQQLAQAAIENLRRAWRATSSDEEIQSLRTGLLGGPADRDPELAPLRKYPEFAGLLRELQRDAGG